MYGCHFQSRMCIKWWQQTNHAFSQHRLANARRTEQRHVMTAGRSNFHSMTRSRLATHICKVWGTCVDAQQMLGVDRQSFCTFCSINLGLTPCLTPQMRNHLSQTRHANNFQ
jgi:hypothetical protein